MERITFRQFLQTYNFREINETTHNEEMINNSQIIRIYYPYNIDDYGKYDTKWIEFGLYDYGTDEYKKEIYESFLRKEILDLYVDQIRMLSNGEWKDTLGVYLTFQKK